MSTAGLIAALAAAFVAGALLYGRFAVAKERCRRVFRDWKKGRLAQRTLRKMWRRYAGQLVQAAVVLVLAVALAAYMIVRGAS